MSELWAVTAYFNPGGFQSRRRNYRLFRERLKAPLVAVELSFGGPCELRPGDAERLIQLRDGDVMWQKERLLNVGLQAVPSGVEKVAWLDCDIVFDSDAWVERAAAALDSHRLVHLFRNRINLSPGNTLETDGPADPALTAASELHYWQTDGGRASSFADANSPVQRRLTCGLAWAARREVLGEAGLYDAAILGSGDRLIIAAALGLFEQGEQVIAMNAAQSRHYRAWATSFQARVDGKVGSVDQSVYHLWHGELRDRRYAARHLGLRPFDFDPQRDIEISPSGCWKWSSAKEDLHRYVQDYFASRREDQ